MPASQTPFSPADPSVPSRRRGRPPGRSHAVGALLAALALIATACSAGPSATPAGPVKLVVGLGYIPNVQFAPFYLADQAGYYREAGLEVEFQNKIDPELVTLVGQGAVDIGISDGTSVIPAVSQGIPIRYAFTLFAQFPNVVFAKASSGIATAADLTGKKVGLPGKFGSNWIQLEALLASVGLTTADLQLVLFPDFGQLAALQQGAVDAATGYANNEPLRLELGGDKASVLALPPTSQLPGPGLIVSAAALSGPKKDALRAFVTATQRAMREIEADPAEGRRRGDHSDPGAGHGPTRAARGPAGDDRPLGERLHAHERHGRRGPGTVGPLDRVHGEPAGQAPREAGQRGGLHDQRAAAVTLTQGL